MLGILEMRRHYANYLKGLPHIKDFRMQLVTVKTQAEVECVLHEIKEKYAANGIAHEEASFINA